MQSLVLLRPATLRLARHGVTVRWTSNRSGDESSRAGGSAHQRDATRGLTGIAGVWKEILEAVQSDGAKLSELVGTLYRHCLVTQTCPPLPAFNEMLRLANERRDRHSASKLVEIMNVNKMQVNADTWARLKDTVTISCSRDDGAGGGGGGGGGNGRGSGGSSGGGSGGGSDDKSASRGSPSSRGDG